MGWGVTSYAACLLCSNGLESHSHLFDLCPFTYQGRRLFLTLLNSQFAPLTSLGVDRVLPCNARRMRLKIVWSWFVWYERNKRLFQQKNSTAQITAASAASFITSCCSSFIKSIISSYFPSYKAACLSFNDIFFLSLSKSLSHCSFARSLARIAVG